MKRQALMVTLVTLLTCLLQATLVTRVNVWGASPDIVVLAVVGVGLLCGSVTGSTCGFCAGILFALMTGTTPGPQALLLVITGYVVGRVGSQLVTDDHPLPPLVGGVVSTLFVWVGLDVIGFLLDPSEFDVYLPGTDVFGVLLFNSFLSIPVFMLLKRIINGSSRTVSGRTASKNSARVAW